MFFGFWSWVLVALVVAAIFAANRLPELQKQAKEKLREGAEAVKKGQKELQEKLNKKAKEEEAKKKASAKKKAAAKDDNKDDDK